jgi:hypothetical protein
MSGNNPQRGRRPQASWEKYVKKYVWDDDSTPYFIPVRKLKRYQADKELLLYCALLIVPAGLLVAAFISAAYNGNYNNLAEGLYGIAVLTGTGFLHYKKSISAALLTISAPVLLLLHFAIYGFEVPDLNINKVAVVAVDDQTDLLELAKDKRWKTGYGIVLRPAAALPKPLVGNTIYYLIRKTDKSSQLAETRAEAHQQKSINLVGPIDGPLMMQRIVQLHIVEKAGMVIIVLLWLRYTMRVVAITRAYHHLSKIGKDGNPWNKFTPGPPPA